MATFTDFIRDTPFGPIVRWVSGARLFRYPEEHPDFLLLHPYIKAAEEGGLSSENVSESDSPTENNKTSNPSTQAPDKYTLVSWYFNDDPANPSNWSLGKKA
ncbi:hypothetical protein ONS95_013403 [Cadophora gregata]|uniref:uncharacterized protein n=1 Tax=Cadophora gregata TaxID=51156 RepID=UPI0026DD3787|nr:uncharacterized protein ONS95_013403 [Cadophora gregata]KAK0099705.1 hypothetical protein ONS96_008201 [Cadophora gregata f. sp. sojae]KAK0116383.1 hypothetical protein ONS95_013403 [Cadophora gregata]